MRKNLLLTLAVLATTLISCSKDDDTTAAPSIVGKWKTEKIDYYTNGQFQETELTVEENSSCPDFIEFKANDTYVIIENDADCNSTVDDNGTYVYNGTTITNNSNGSMTIGTVISLTSTDMKIDFTETSSQGIVFKNVGYFKKVN